MESSSPKSRIRNHENVEKNDQLQIKKPKLHNEQICHKENETTTAEIRRNWLDLPPDLMVMILRKVGAAEILETVQLVCTSWCKICDDPHTWTCIDMHNCNDSFYTPQTLDNLTRIAVDRSCGELVDLNLEGFGNDELLRYITERSPRVTRLRLAECYGVSDDGLIEAVSKLPWLTDIDLTLGSSSESAIHVIGRSYPLLKSFKYNTRARRYFPLDKAEDKCFDDTAFAIAGNMPGLHHLMLLGNTLSNDGLQAILDGCSHLVSLDLRCCFNINLDGALGKRCSEQILDFRGPWDSTFDYPYETKVENWIETDDYDYYEFDSDEYDMDDYYNELYSDEYDLIKDFANEHDSDDDDSDYDIDDIYDDSDDDAAADEHGNGINELYEVEYDIIKKFENGISGDDDDNNDSDNDAAPDEHGNGFNELYSVECDIMKKLKKWDIYR